ncbi:MAG: universal stress protein [Solirubrobacterales bacterium]
MTPGGTVVVGYDGSEASRAAITHAVTIARGRPVVVVHAYEAAPPDLAGRWRALLEPDRRAAGQAVLDGILLEGNDELADVDWEARLEPGRPAEAIMRVADELDADAIVVGTHGHGRLEALLGSVSHELVRHSTRPVTVLPPPCVDRLRRA